MATGTDTVARRVDTFRVSVSPARFLVSLAVVLVLASTLVVVQEPAVHDAMHDFRHVTGITCH